MDKLFAQYKAIYNDEYLPNSFKMCQNVSNVLVNIK